MTTGMFPTNVHDGQVSGTSSVPVCRNMGNVSGGTTAPASSTGLRVDIDSTSACVYIRVGYIDLKSV
jgi:hypothetical protein